MQSIEYYIRKLLEYCEKENFSGYDPYDGLNSRLFQKSPFQKSRIFRLAVIQLIKRLPINIRPLLLIPKTQNPKALALFLMAFIKLKKAGLLENDDLIDLMIERLIALRSPGHLINLDQMDKTDQIDQKDQINCQRSTGNCQRKLRPSSLPASQLPSSYSCWGYSFPWQTRTILVPRGAPNLVCTVFVANALLDAYEFKKDERCLEMAKSAAEYILNELFWEDDSVACFSYPLPSLKNKVHNANFLGSALLCRVYAHCGEQKFLEPALTAARYSASRQNHDGSWYYGEHPTQQWIDNFHTGYNLCALKAICKYADTSEFRTNIDKGLQFYRNNFFDGNGIAKYFHDRTYPIDIHSVAQSIITLLEFAELESDDRLAHSVFNWAISNMWDDKGYFYYQIHPAYKTKIPYMRWSEAWMLLGLAAMAENIRAN